MKVHKWRALTIILLLVFVPNASGSFVDFIRMINSLTSYSAGDFSGYGNFCGVGGGGTPLDNIDRCCQAHDECLSRINRASCFPLYILNLSFYIINYKYMQVNDDIICYQGNSACQQGLCECDRVCAECFKEFEGEYNRALKRSIL